MSTAPPVASTSPGIPAAEFDITETLVRDLLRAQHPDLADLPLRLVATGWDNMTFRLGDALAVRMPRITAAAELIVREQTWLPVLAQGLPVPVPVPVRLGQPGCGYPWPWSVVPWVPGRSGEHQSPAVTEAARFGQFLAALHQPAPADAPRNTYRGVPLADLGEQVRTRMTALARSSACADLPHQEIWERWHAAAAAPTDTPATWLHGDLHPKNIVCDGGRLAAVIDWGDMTVGDRATDLGATWMLFPVGAHAAVWAGYGEISAATRCRAAGWALTFGLMLLEVGLANDPPFAVIGRRTLRRVLAA